MSRRNYGVAMTTQEIFYLLCEYRFASRIIMVHLQCDKKFLLFLGKEELQTQHKICCGEIQLVHSIILHIAKKETSENFKS